MNKSNKGNATIRSGRTRTPRVAYLTNRLLDWETREPHFGGGERYCVTLSMFLRELGFDVTLYQSGNSAFEGEYRGFKVIALPAGEQLSEFHPGVCNAFYEASADYDHVIYNLPNYASGKVREDGILICHGIWFDHDNYPPPTTFRTPEWFAHLYASFSHIRKVVSVDTNSISVIRALWPELAARMTYLPNWVDTTIFRPAIGRRSKEITVLIPRRSDVNRGSGILREILERIPYDCRFLWVGGGDEKDTETVRAAARRDPRLKLFSASFEEMPLYYSQADICVIPSIASEGTSLACLEGMASGCAIVATNIGGLPDLIQDGISGLLVDPNPDRIAAAINHLIEQPEERAHLAKTGMEVAGQFMLEKWKERWTEVLRQTGWISKQHGTAVGVKITSGPKLKVAIVTRNAIHGGVESLIALHQKQFKADVFVAGGYNCPETCPFEYAYIDSAEELGARVELCKRLASYDLILYHWLPSWALEAIREAGRPSIEVVHRTDTSDNDKSVPTLVVTHSEFLANHIRDQYGREALVIPYAIDIAKFPEESKGEYVGAITSYYQTKGIDLFLQAWSKVQERFPETPVRFYGAGNDLPLYQTMTRDLGLKNVELLDPVRFPEKHISEFRLFVQPSRIEGMPIAILEALACNIPVVCSDQPGMVEFNRLAQQRGFDSPLILVRTEDVEELAVRLTEALSQQQEPRHTRDYVLQYYSAETNKQSYESAFKRCLARYAANENDRPSIPTLAYLRPPTTKVIERPVVAGSNGGDRQQLAEYFESQPAGQQDLLLENVGKVVKAMLVDLLEVAIDSDSDDKASDLLKRTALHLSASLTEREQAVVVMKTRLEERDRAAKLLETELEVREKVVTARDEAIAWLNEELTNSRKENVTLAESLAPLITGYRRLAEVEAQLAELVARFAARDSQVQSLSAQLSEMQRSNQSLSAQLSETQRSNQSLSAQLNETQRANESLSAQLNERQRANESLSADLAMQRERADAAERIVRSEEAESAQILRQLTEVKLENASRTVDYEEQKRKMDRLDQILSDKVQALDYRTAQFEEREKIIAARDEAIVSLRTALAEAQRKGERLEGSNAILSQQLAKKENARQALAGRLAETEAELRKIVNSIGWQILSRYGRVKYRYLLPVYRALGLMRTQAESPEQAQLTPVGPSLESQLSEPSATHEADAERAVQQLLAEMAKPSEETGNRERAAAFKPDFYESLTLLPHLEQEQIEAILDKEPPAAPSRRLDVICFSIIDWEFRYQRPQQIMSQFSAHGHRVFYVSTTRFLSSDASPRVLVKRIKENVYEVQLAAARMPDVYGEVIEGGNKRTLLDALDELRSTYQINDAIGYVMIASWGAVALEAKRVWGWRTIYDCMDEWENFPGIKRELLDMELELVRQSDLLVVTGQLLYNKFEKYGRAMVLARNAVDWDFYNEQYRPNTLLTDIKHPVIGYYGAVADWFDVELLSEAARQRPQYTFVILGGIFDVDVSSLSALPNVLLLGQQPYETMPKYLFHFDVCMIPFKINPITEATDPVKVYEYLSAGKPVVSVMLPELEPLREYVYIGKDRDDFVVQLDRAVLEDDSEMVARRRRFAHENTWENRYRQIETGLSQVVPRASIIIVTYNNLALNKLCLESLIRNTEYPNYEIIVVDNDSKDGTPAYLRYLAAQYPSISIILNQTNHGFARANNQGIARTSGDYIVLLNNDTIVPPGWLSRLVRHLENDSVGMVGPVTNFVGNEAKIEIDYQTWREMEQFAARQIWEHDRRSADIYMLAMFCVAFRRETYDEIGPLDEQFGIGMFEDDDYAQRMKAKGYRVMCAADVFVHHFGQAAFKKLIENGSYNPLFEENRSYYETKWNVTWTPHKHARLKFEQLTHAPLDIQAAGKKR